MDRHGVGIVLVAAALMVGLTGFVLAQDAPTVDEVTALRWEIAALKQQVALAQASTQVCQGQLAPTTYRATMDVIAQDIEALRAAFTAAHPGWTLDDQGRASPKGE